MEGRRRRVLKLTDEGYVEHRGHQVWWGAVGGHEVADRVPVLTIHGGPGMPHDCLEPLAALAAGRRVIFYDQYGCGRSDRAADPTDYEIGLFVEEIDALRRALGLTEVHLFAHSYGGPLALEYLLSEQRAGVRSLVLSNSFASVPALAAGWTRRLAELGDAAHQALAAGPAEGDGEAYGSALGQFIDRFVLPLPPPEPMMRAQMHSGAEVYTRMHGSSWFEPDGQWADWDATDRLGRLTVPTLVVGGVRDQCVPELSEAIHAGIGGSELAVLDTAHLPFFEEPERYIGLVADFLQRADGTPGAEVPQLGTA